mmetsp:Transcript_98806/g.316753  ORF Transcript_98806/g.316753 Transcript_98806/m.316753 type:complete len:96 (+) Transcript_98806:259-546(+)
MRCSRYHWQFGVEKGQETSLRRDCALEGRRLVKFLDDAHWRSGSVGICTTITCAMLFFFMTVASVSLSTFQLFLEVSSSDTASRHICERGGQTLS